ncbi:sulfur oxidation c-type cytochrome SoxX [Phreatobacter aquaticus]|uniref:Sulfur oxidation c-type cytochrome SoxX n=1 Tax=Phreatobacter aquaticus TaxID=2570229 RepID=A0A4D7QI94_9HYPH|nr:sulfur oxidation c-type cytochrome SoxX [Phreatobacter aquaticus]QCK87430.1 sulfur oxidation c-type cytochrome SoxX [Phreatobacter aquaticus]
MARLIALWIVLVSLTDPTFADARLAAPAGLTGDAVRGRALVGDRRKSFCLLCHTGPFPEERFMGNLAPPLDGAGSRWSVDELRLRLVDSTRLNLDTIMPAYGRADGLERVARQFQGQPLLSPQDIEDIVAFLANLKE